jgi:hypothetical protein
VPTPLATILSPGPRAELDAEVDYRLDDRGVARIDLEIGFERDVDLQRVVSGSASDA